MSKRDSFLLLEDMLEASIKIIKYSKNLRRWPTKIRGKEDPIEVRRSDATTILWNVYKALDSRKSGLKVVASLDNIEQLDCKGSFQYTQNL